MSNTRAHSTTIRAAITLAALFIAAIAHAQDSPISNAIIDYTHDKLHKAQELIDTKLDDKNSLYISPNLYNMTVMTQYSYNYEYYRFSTTESPEQSISFRPDNGNKIGFYAGWRWIFFGWSFDLTKNDAKKDINLSFYTSKLGIDLFYRRRDKGFKISDIDGTGSNGEPLNKYRADFTGFSSKQQGFNLYYIFNHRRFSYPAAYSQTTTQRISAGSFLLGLSYNAQTFTFNHAELGEELQAGIHPELKFNQVQYKDYSINFGYSYNWVFAKNLLANISLTPAIGYKNSSLQLKSGKEFLASINFDFITRAAIVYNNRKYFAGASFVSHTYSYRKSSLSVVNGFGSLNVYLGFYFWRNKKVKE